MQNLCNLNNKNQDKTPWHSNIDKYSEISKTEGDSKNIRGFHAFRRFESYVKYPYASGISIRFEVLIPNAWALSVHF